MIAIGVQDLTETAPVPTRPVLSLHDTRSGRLRADYITSFFQISQNDMARLLGISLASLRRFPAAPRLQRQLAVFESIAAALLILAGTDENARAWLNLPDEQLDDLTPLDVIKEGQGHVVAEMLEDMLWGQPS